MQQDESYDRVREALVRATETMRGLEEQIAAPKGALEPAYNLLIVSCGVEHNCATENEKEIIERVRIAFKQEEVSILNPEPLGDEFQAVLNTVPYEQEDGKGCYLPKK